MRDYLIVQAWVVLEMQIREELVRNGEGSFLVSCAIWEAVTKACLEALKCNLTDPEKLIVNRKVPERAWL